MNTSIKYPAEVLSWLITSLQTVPLYYGVIPVKELYKVFQNGKDFYPARNGASGVGDISENEYEEMLRGLLAIANRPEMAGTPGLVATGITCKFDGNELVPIDDNGLVKAIRSERIKYPVPDYRILTHDEVMQVVLLNGYVETPETYAFMKYLKSRWRKSKHEAITLVRHFSIGFRTGEDTLQDTISELSHILGADKPENAIPPEEFMKMLNLVTSVQQTTGLMTRKGWSPSELYEKHYGQKAPSVECNFHQDSDDALSAVLSAAKPGTTIVPGSSRMATILKEHEKGLKDRGVNIDYDMNASRYRDTNITPEGTVQKSRAQKVYPNDLCPCGSMLKYKDCHDKV